MTFNFSNNSSKEKKIQQIQWKVHGQIKEKKPYLIFSLSFFIPCHAEFNTKLNDNRSHGTWNGVSIQRNWELGTFETMRMLITRLTKNKGGGGGMKEKCLWFLWQNFRHCSFWLRSWLTCFILHGFWVYFWYLVYINEAPYTMRIIAIVLNNKQPANTLEMEWGLSETKDATKGKKPAIKSCFYHFFRFHEFVPFFNILFFFFLYPSFAQFKIVHISKRWSRTGGLSEIQLCQIIILNSSRPFNQTRPTSNNQRQQQIRREKNIAFVYTFMSFQFDDQSSQW